MATRIFFMTAPNRYSLEHTVGVQSGKLYRTQMCLNHTRRLLLSPT
jgi:hypothetical protein